MLTDYYQLPVYENESVDSIVQASQEMPSGLGDGNATYAGYDILTGGGGKVFARFVVWAVGEFQFPKRPSISCAHLGVHSSEVTGQHDLQHQCRSPLNGRCWRV